MQSNGEGVAPIGSWSHIASAINNEVALMEEPVGSRLEYRVSSKIRAYKIFKRARKLSTMEIELLRDGKSQTLLYYLR